MFLAKSIAQKAERLHIDELCFMDNNEKKLSIYGGMAAHVAKLLCPKMKFTLTADAVAAVKDADYVITTIRVGEDDMRAKDERIALNKGVLGQETTGAAGFSFAMRSVPALAEYCELINKPKVKYIFSSFTVFYRNIIVSAAFHGCALNGQAIPKGLIKLHLIFL